MSHRSTRNKKHAVKIKACFWTQGHKPCKYNMMWQVLKWVKLEFLSMGPLGTVFFFVELSFPAHYTMFSSIPGFHLLNASSNLPPDVTARNAWGHCQMSSEQHQSCLQLRKTSLKWFWIPNPCLGQMFREVKGGKTVTEIENAPTLKPDSSQAPA